MKYNIRNVITKIVEMVYGLMENNVMMVIRLTETVVQIALLTKVIHAQM